VRTHDEVKVLPCDIAEVPDVGPYFAGGGLGDGPFVERLEMGLPFL